jgi:hypothetical protein
MSQSTPPPKASPTASGREDFIKRLFAVTLSVGIANQFSHVMLDPSAVVDHHLTWHPFYDKWRDLLLLLISLIIVVSSWEGYLQAVLRNPLEDAGRFWVDIAIVFTYLILTLSTEDPGAWFLIHVAIFVEYMIWDILRSHLSTFVSRKNIYEGSLTITVVWLAFFFILFLMKRYCSYFDKSLGFVAISLAVLSGVFLYRSDKKYRERWTWPIKASVTGGLLCTLILLAALNVG